MPRFDVVCENFKAGTMDRLGLGYDVVAERHPGVDLPVAVGLREHRRDAVPVVARLRVRSSRRCRASTSTSASRAGRRGPTPSARSATSARRCSATIGVLAALRHRDRTGEGQQIDVAMLDAVVAMTDIVTNLWSMGIHGSVEDEIKAIVDTFAAGDGYFVLQCVRPQHFTALAEVIGRPEWNDDPRFATSAGWIDNIGEVARRHRGVGGADDQVRGRGRSARPGLAAGPCLTPPEVIADPHVAARHMLVETPRTDDPDGERGPILVPGNPVKMSKVAEGPETRVPWLGEHTDRGARAPSWGWATTTSPSCAPAA